MLSTTLQSSLSDWLEVSHTACCVQLCSFIQWCSSPSVCLQHIRLAFLNQQLDLQQVMFAWHSGSYKKAIPSPYWVNLIMVSLQQLEINTQAFSSGASKNAAMQCSMTSQVMCKVLLQGRCYLSPFGWAFVGRGPLEYHEYPTMSGVHTLVNNSCQTGKGHSVPSAFSRP